MELWIPITVLAAFLQNVRSATQKHLKRVMGTTGATFVRFAFGCPVAIMIVLILHHGVGSPIPNADTAFLVWVAVGGLSQIAATAMLVHLFALRNFAVGTAYSRTEPAQAALFGLVFLAETITPATLVAIAVSVAGVMLISVARLTFGIRTMLASLAGRPALIGLGSGSLFGLSAVAYRAA